MTIGGRENDSQLNLLIKTASLTQADYFLIYSRRRTEVLLARECFIATTRPNFHSGVTSINLQRQIIFYWVGALQPPLLLQLTGEHNVHNSILPGDSMLTCITFVLLFRWIWLHKRLRKRICFIAVSLNCST